MSSGMRFAVTLGPTPLLNTPYFRSSFGGPDGSHIPIDEQGLLKTIESVALPRTKLKVLEKLDQPHILRVSTAEYPIEVYVDERFVMLVEEEPQERPRQLLSVPDLLFQLESLQGTPYIWGGNWPEGIPSLKEHYPPSSPLSDPIIAATWQLRGVDCSGLLYYVTDGITPRNTSALIAYGEPIDIENKSAAEIVGALNDLDLIVWRGHVVIVLNEAMAIESFVGKGVITTPLLGRIEEILKKRVPVNDYVETEDLGARFCVRRWHRDNL